MKLNICTDLERVKIALRNWSEANSLGGENESNNPTPENNLIYLLAFLEANDDLFDHSFRREIAEATDVPIGVSTKKSALELAVDAAREEERELTYGGGVAPDGFERLPAFVSVDRALASAPSLARRRAVRIAWDRVLRTDSGAVGRLADEVANIRRSAATFVAPPGAEAFIQSFSDAVIDGAQTAFSSSSSSLPSLLAAATVAMEEGPRMMLTCASQVREPMLDVDRVCDRIVASLSAITSADVRTQLWDDRRILTFTLQLAPDITRTGSVIVWFLPSSPDSMSRVPDIDSQLPEHVSENVPVAHIGLRSDVLSSGQRVMHMRDLRSTLHELGHALHHALTADRAPLSHGLESAGVTEIDLLSTWQEWSIFDEGWNECVLGTSLRSPEIALSTWQGLLRLETLKELPLRALVVVLDHVWAKSPQEDYEEIWLRVTQSNPKDHPSLYLEALHRLTWPIPTSRPGGEFGLFWAMSEVAQHQLSDPRHGSFYITHSWIDRILGASPDRIPDPHRLVRFLLPGESELNCPARTTVVTEEIMNLPAYPVDYIAAMLPARETALTDVLRRALVDDHFPPIQIDDNAARLLQCLTLMARPKLVVEIGALFGFSTIHLARGLPAEGRLISYEIDPRAAESARENVERLGLSDRVEVSTEDAVAAIPLLGTEVVDLIFVDGAKRDYVSYLKVAFPALAPGGVLIVDDAFAGGTYADIEGVEDADAGAAIRKVVAALARSTQVTVSFLGTENGMLLAVKNGINDA